MCVDWLLAYFACLSVNVVVVIVDGVDDVIITIIVTLILAP